MSAMMILKVPLVVITRNSNSHPIPNTKSPGALGRQVIRLSTFTEKPFRHPLGVDAHCEEAVSAADHQGENRADRSPSRQAAGSGGGVGCAVEVSVVELLALPL